MSSPLATWAPRLALTLGLAATVGCVRPNVPTRPIDSCAVLRQVSAEREPEQSGDPFTMAQAVQWMRQGSPAIRKARADWRAAQAIADCRTPYPNPTIEAGPLLLGGLDALGSATWGIEAALGWTVLLTDTPALTDDLNAVTARAAFVEAASAEREAYLGLRGDYTSVRLQTDLAHARSELARAAEETMQIAARAVEAGEATTLDVNLLGLETTEIRTEVLESEEAVADARGDLGARLGVRALGPGAPEPMEVPPLPASVPDLDTLRQTVIDNHPHLTALRAAYLVVEKELRLEVARRYPPIGFGFTYEYEDLNKFGLPLGIEIPLFDRNQPAIAAVCGRRTALRDKYAAEVNAILAEVERARARLEVRRTRLALREAQVGPAAETQRLAETVLRQTGTFDMLRYLEVLRATRRARVDLLATRASVYEAWSELERACGAPLLAFPSLADAQDGDA